MPKDDRIGVITPEAVEFTFDLSGLASRVLALFVDLLIQFILIIILMIFASYYINYYTSSEHVVMVFFIIGIFIFNWLYFMLFELFWNGRSPGKRAMGCRVIRDGGMPVNFTSSLIRNFLRPVDYILSALMIGFFIVFASPTYKRLGDLAAGTIVITERRISLMQLLADRRVGTFRSTQPPIGLFTMADVSVLSADQLHTIRRFLERRFDLPPDKRSSFATDLFSKVAELMPAVKGHGIRVEHVLEEIIVASEGEELSSVE
jgi:uncharacterized RDD family membrane protein YckC